MLPGELLQLLRNQRAGEPASKINKNRGKAPLTYFVLGLVRPANIMVLVVKQNTRLDHRLNACSLVENLHQARSVPGQGKCTLWAPALATRGC